MHIPIFVLVTLSTLAIVNAGRNIGLQEQGNIWSAKLVGKELLLASEAEGAFDPQTQFRESELPSPYRIIRPGDIITEDYNPSRLNVDIDSNNIVTEAKFY